MQTSKTAHAAVILCCLATLAPAAPTEMSITAYLADTNEPIEWMDPNVPYVYPEMMAGTQLNLVVSSDVPRLYWGGIGLYITEPFWQQGQLFGRGYNALTGLYEGSSLPAAGLNSLVGDNYAQIFNEWAYGLEFSIMVPGADAGDWFVVDFNSYEPGECILDFMDIRHEDAVLPAFSLYLPLVATRDYNQDHVVNLGDFSLMAQSWQEELDPDPNRVPDYDLDGSTQIDWHDMHSFTAFWLARTRGLHRNDADPNEGTLLSPSKSLF